MKKTSRSRAPASDSQGVVRFGPLENAIGFHLRMAQEASFAAFARRAHQQRLRAGKFAVLQLVCENPGITQTALSKASGRDKSTLTSTLRELVSAGLIARERMKHDGRASALRLTAKGEAGLAGLKSHAERHDAQLDAIVGPARRKEFIAILRAIALELNGSGGRGRR